MNNTVSNIKKEVPSNTSLNDKDYLTCVLETLKNNVNNYSYALNEASNDYLYFKIKEIFDEASKMQREVYNLMFKNGWYSLCKEDEVKVKEKHSDLTNKINELA